MNTITFSSSRQGVNETITPLEGSLTIDNNHEDVSANESNAFNNVRLGVGRGGSCLVRIDSIDFTVANALSLVSTVGECDFEVSGDDIQTAVGAFVKVEILSSGIKICKITWAGTKEV